VLLSEVDRHECLTDSIAERIQDRRDSRYVRHKQRELIGQRVYQIAMGYEDCSDSDSLRSDPALKTAVGRCPESDADLASQPTFSRLENGVDGYDIKGLHRLLVEHYLKKRNEAPKRMFLDIDATDGPAHGKQLDHAVGVLLHALPDQAKEMLPKLRLFHPKEIATRLSEMFYACGDNRVRARVVWTMGELCGQDALNFLIGCTSSEATNIRRLAASAIGKVARSVSSDARAAATDMERAKQVLLKLTDDPGVQVRQYAKKSLTEFSGKDAERGLE